MTENTATAAELVADLADADEEKATAILNGENERPEPRKTVVAAAQARLEALASPGEPLAKVPEGAWAQLLDGDGNPVLEDGNPVAVAIES
jgi:hypothetical protein